MPALQNHHDLSYASSAWPVPLLYQILVKCVNVKSLALINLRYRIVEVIPASVTSVHVHGRFDIRHLLCAACLARMTSIDTSLTDREVQKLVSVPSLRSFRRFYSTPTAIGHAFDQLAAVRVGRSLWRMETVLREGSDDDRVVITARTSHMEYGRLDGIHAFYDD
ncbi:hypothetical protein FOMPIDRAFT_1053994 [Fomitopsis schrenkii]|uniref:Uncharacterized protein n=1 Tax=Fomitopsis schrenkii TaxID=2126942 RepID=S8DQR6_FOMSC|nr:hypothetical protein FOMPIDRAFT_1053994 [Fomitopsis schrenkii]